jgi:hypothetical protein
METKQSMFKLHRQAIEHRETMRMLALLPSGSKVNHLWCSSEKFLAKQEAGITWGSHFCRALRGYCRSSSGPAERSLHHGRSSPKFRLPDPCPLAYPSHAICLLAMRNERARRRRPNWPIYCGAKWC